MSGLCPSGRKRNVRIDRIVIGSRAVAACRTPIISEKTKSVHLVAVALVAVATVHLCILPSMVRMKRTPDYLCRCRDDVNGDLKRHTHSDTRKSARSNQFIRILCKATAHGHNPLNSSASQTQTQNNMQTSANILALHFAMPLDDVPIRCVLSSPLMLAFHDDLHTKMFANQTDTQSYLICKRSQHTEFSHTLRRNRERKTSAAPAAI